MILGCIDIGSNTTRLLVADATRGRVRELWAERVFTCIRKSLDPAGAIPPEKLEETVSVVASQARTARELGAGEVVAVATAAIRDAPNQDELARGVRDAADVQLKIISSEEEARLSFVGATRTLPDLEGDAIAVLDVGGGSTEIAIGPRGGAPGWWRSLPIGSGLLADRHLRSDPPAPEEIEAARRAVDETFGSVTTPPADAAIAVGGTATSLLRVSQEALDRHTLERSIGMLCAAPIADLARRLGLEAERVRLLPAGILVLQAACDRLGPLHVARGGLREGVMLEMMDGT